MQAEQRMAETLITIETEQDAIRQTIQKYIDGGKSGKSDDMRPAFHEGATMYGYIGDELLGGPVEHLFEWNDKNGPARDLESRITGIDVAGTIATVRIELDNWTGHKFTDMFTLLKVDGEWKIISKVFYLHPAD